MELIHLKDQLSLGIVHDGSRLRMFVTDGTQELVCHKLTQKELDKFLQCDAAHLFKGRLQLAKNNDALLVTVKGKEAGIVSPRDILKLTQLK